MGTCICSVIFVVACIFVRAFFISFAIISEADRYFLFVHGHNLPFDRHMIEQMQMQISTYPLIMFCHHEQRMD